MLSGGAEGPVESGTQPESLIDPRLAFPAIPGQTREEILRELSRRVAAQGPEYRKALDAVRARDGRRFFLKNTAPNLAGAELQDMVKAAIENNAGRLTTISITAPRDDGRFRVIGVNLQLFATTANLQRILYTVETQQPYLVVENMRISPLNAFRGFKPAPGSEPEVNVLLDVVGFANAEAEKK